MRHQTAIGNIDHNSSILYYDNSMKTRLAYHPTYKTTYAVSNFDDRLLQNLLQNSS